MDGDAGVGGSFQIPGNRGFNTGWSGIAPDRMSALDRLLEMPSALAGKMPPQRFPAQRSQS